MVQRQWRVVCLPLNCFITLHPMGLYEGPLLEWFLKEWKKVSDKKLDMGKCCVRFKKPEDIPVKLIGELVKKMKPKDWIAIYENAIKKPK
jgi:hypothetical protein